MTETKQNAHDSPPNSMPSGSESATDILSAADALHAELLRQCESLMDAAPGSPEEEDLARIAAIVEAYEQVRW